MHANKQIVYSDSKVLPFYFILLIVRSSFIDCASIYIFFQQLFLCLCACWCFGNNHANKLLRNKKIRDKNSLEEKCCGNRMGGLKEDTEEG